MTTHTPLIKLQAANRRFQLAQEACPHWDYESDGCGHTCCNEMVDAERALYRIRAEVSKEN